MKENDRQFDFRGWDFPVATQRQVSTLHTPRSGAALGTVAMPVRRQAAVCFQAGGRGSSHR